MIGQYPRRNLRNGNKIGAQSLLTSSFKADAVLISGPCILEKRLRMNPALKGVSHGTILRYALLSGPDSIGGQIIEFGQSHITYTYPTDVQTVNLYSDNLSKFIAILGFVDDLYEIKFHSLYTYVLEAIDPEMHALRADMGIACDESVLDKLETLNSANISLAKSLIKLEGTMGALKSRIAVQKRICAAAIKAFSELHGNGWQQLIAERYGIEEGDLKAAQGWEVI